MSMLRMVAIVTRYKYVKNGMYQTAPTEPLTFEVKCNIHTKTSIEGQTHLKNDDGQLLLNLTHMTVDIDTDIQEDDFVSHNGKDYEIKNLKIHTLIPAKTCILIEKEMPKFSGRKEDYV